MINKYKYLFKNIGLLTISRFSTSILTFFLVPIYTSVLSTGEYGTYDLINSTVNLLIPVLTLNIGVAVFRFSVDGKERLPDILTIGIRYIFKGVIAISGILVGLFVFQIGASFRKYAIYMLFMFVFTAFYELISNFVRGLEKVKEFAVAGIISTLSLISFNVLFLLVIKIGLSGYFIAHILSSAVPTLYLMIAIRCEKFWSRNPNKCIEREMVGYSVPLIANSVGWWINNVSDRYIVTFFCGISANGVYSMAYKIPTILSILQNIFNQAWVLSAVKDFDQNDETGFFRKIYNAYNFVNVAMCSLLIMTCKIIAKYMYANDFYSAWVYVPWLLISIVFGGMSGFFGCIFSAVKQSKIFGQSTIIGAVVNFVLNIVLVFFIGPMGAAIATAISYFTVWLIRLVHTSRYIKLKINIYRDVVVYLCLIMQAVALIYLRENAVMYAAQILLFGAIVFLSRREIVGLLGSGHIMLKERKRKE